MYILSYDLSGMILALLFAIIHRFLFDRKEAVNKMFQTFMLIAAFECGMNIVANLVKEMGGSISVESELFVGTKFHVEIPILFYDSAIIYSSPRNEEVINRDRVDLSAIKILCVDDTEINRTVFKGLLNKTGAYKLGRI